MREYEDILNSEHASDQAAMSKVQKRKNLAAKIMWP
jgi:hypothetical protein